MMRLVGGYILIVVACCVSVTDGADPTCKADDEQCSSGFQNDYVKKGATSSYLYPQGRGQPRDFGQSPHRFGGKACNLAKMLNWNWTHPDGRFAATVTGKALVDDERSIYFTNEMSITKFNSDGNILWQWYVPGFPNYKYPHAHLPNHAALYDGLLYSARQDGYVFALDMKTGQEVWKKKMATDIGPDTAFVTAYDGRIFVDVETPEPMIDKINTVVALNSSTGDLLWRYTPDTGVWNFLPHFPGDDTLVFMGWSGDAHRVNITNGKELWRSGPVGSSNTIGWTDGGPALGPNGVFYTVSSTGKQDESMKSKGGGLHAYSIADGKLLWEHTDFEQGVYTYPGVGYLNPDGDRSDKDDSLAVITGVGSLAGLAPGIWLEALKGLWPKMVGIGMVVWLGLFMCRWLMGCCCRKPKPRPKFIWYGPILWTLIVVLFQALFVIGFIYTNVAKHGYDTSIRAFNAKTGTMLWRLDLQKWEHYAAAGDEDGVIPRTLRGVRPLCLPCASGYGVVDAQGVFWMHHLDGLLYRVKDWNGDGKIEEGTDEVCTIDLLAGSTTGGVTIVPGMLLVATCDTLYVFKDDTV